MGLWASGPGLKPRPADPVLSPPPCRRAAPRRPAGPCRQYTITAEDCGRCLHVVYTPVAADDAVGQPLSVVSPVVVAAPLQPLAEVEDGPLPFRCETPATMTCSPDFFWDHLRKAFVFHAARLTVFPK